MDSHCFTNRKYGLSAWQAPVGYDEHSFGYRDLEGAKVHKALREAYGKAYKEGDVIGCFIHMPEGGRRLEKSKAVSLLSESPFLMRCMKVYNVDSPSTLVSLARKDVAMSKPLLPHFNTLLLHNAKRSSALPGRCISYADS